MTYKPNFTDARVIKRIKTSIAFVERFVSAHKSQWLSTRQIDKHFGCNNRPLGHYLREQLLTCTNNYYNQEQGKCKEYRANLEGIEYLKQALGLRTNINVLTVDQQQQLATGEITYETKSNRDYNPMQYIPSRIRPNLLAKNGYPYQFDIQCCAPRLILQRARQLGMPHDCLALDAYVNNRSQIRNQIATQVGISDNDVKFIINALLQGGTISRYPHNAILIHLNYNYHVIDLLKRNTYIQELITDIKMCWSSIKTMIPERYLIDCNGNTRRRALSGKDKSGVYRELEESVGVVIKRYLKRTHNLYLWEHDGWTSKNMIDISELRSEVKRQTGFVIELDWTVHEYTDAS